MIGKIFIVDLSENSIFRSTFFTHFIFYASYEELKFKAVYLGYSKIVDNLRENDKINLNKCTQKHWYFLIFP